MKLKTLYITIILIVSVLIANAGNTELLDSAKQYYKNKEYEKAINTYKQIIKSGYEAPEVYYNIGNCYYKLDSIAYSILYYEKAKLLAPNDEDIDFNLKIANLKTIDKLDVLPKFFLTEWYDNFLDLFSSNTWAYINITALILFLTILLLFFFSRKASQKRVLFYLSLILLITTIFTFKFSKKQKDKIQAHNYAIIITPTVNAKNSPDDSSNDSFIIHEGTKIKLLDKVDDWTEIKLSDGSIGWVKNNDFAVI